MPTNKGKQLTWRRHIKFPPAPFQILLLDPHSWVRRISSCIRWLEMCVNHVMELGSKTYTNPPPSPIQMGQKRRRLLSASCCFVNFNTCTFYRSAFRAFKLLAGIKPFVSYICGFGFFGNSSFNPGPRPPYPVCWRLSMAGATGHSTSQLFSCKWHIFYGLSLAARFSRCN